MAKQNGNTEKGGVPRVVGEEVKDSRRAAALAKVTKLREELDALLKEQTPRELKLREKIREAQKELAEAEQRR